MSTVHLIELMADVVGVNVILVIALLVRQSFMRKEMKEMHEILQKMSQR